MPAGIRWSTRIRTAARLSGSGRGRIAPRIHHTCPSVPLWRSIAARRATGSICAAASRTRVAVSGSRPATGSVTVSVVSVPAVSGSGVQCMASGLWCVSFMSRFSLGVDGVGVFVLVDGLGGFLVVLLGVGGGEFGPSGVFVGAHAAAAVVGGAGDGVAVADE